MVFLCIYDTETTGKDPTMDAVISLGCVVTQLEMQTDQVSDTSDSGTVPNTSSVTRQVLQNKGTFHSYIQTDRTIPQAAIAVHGIQPSMLVGKPPFPEVWSLFSDFLNLYPGPKVLVAHNGRGFDDPCIYCNAVRHGVDFVSFLEQHQVIGFLDTLAFLRGTFGSAPEREKPQDQQTGRVSFELGHCHQTWCGEKIDGAHDALVDALATARVLNAPPVSRRYNLHSLLSGFMVPTVKSLRWIRQQAGSRIQQEELRIRQNQVVPQEASHMVWVKDLGSDISPLSEAPSLDSTWTTSEEKVDYAAATQMDSYNYRICLKCMCFISLSVSHECCLAPQSVQKAQDLRQRASEKARSVRWTTTDSLWGESVSNQCGAMSDSSREYSLSTITPLVHAAVR